jgi:sugar transferase (PEP-CTERM/EpsH1 system associated)
MQQTVQTALGPAAAVDEVLLLCHRIPYPPDKGDKIRAWRWLTGLAQRYTVHLGAFVDDPEDWAHADRLRAICGELYLRPQPGWTAKLRALAALPTDEPLTSVLYRDQRMGAWVEGLLRRRGVSRIIVFSSAMAQYAASATAATKRRIIDFVDVDADKWRQYAAHARPPHAWIYGREARALLAHDATVARCFDASVFVSRPEAELFRGLSGVAACVSSVPNGVDADYFAPLPERPTPFTDGAPVLVFTGAMDYRANIDAAHWFAACVWPQVREELPAARLYLVGSRPSREVLALRRDDIVVTGRVDDVRPYLQHAAAVIAPMRIARGVQNKVLEGMAMGRVVLTTSMGAEGIEAEAGRHLLVEDEPRRLAQRAIEALRAEHVAVGGAARAWVRSHYAWPGAIARFIHIVAGDVPAGRETT